MLSLAKQLVDTLESQDLMIATAESCTGGLISTTITDIAGSSAVFDRGFITYSNSAKIQMLSVAQDIIEQYGAVSTETAKAMAEGALKNSNAQISVSCTGIAGPGGGTEEKPVGLVFIGIAKENDITRSFEHHFDGDRTIIRQQTVEACFSHLLDLL